MRDRLREVVGNDGDFCAEGCARKRPEEGSAHCADRCQTQVQNAEAEIETAYRQCLDKKP